MATPLLRCRSASLRVRRFSIFMRYSGLKAMTTPLYLAGVL